MQLSPVLAGGVSAAWAAGAIRAAVISTSEAKPAGREDMFMAGAGGGDPDWIGCHDDAAGANANLPQAWLTDVTVHSVRVPSGRAGFQA
ncbi:hypothetical protein D3C72_1581840 [compost metagenome]